VEYDLTYVTLILTKFGVLARFHSIISGFVIAQEGVSHKHGGYKMHRNLTSSFSSHFQPRVPIT